MIKRNKTLSDVLDAVFYLLYQRDVLSEREYESLFAALPDVGETPDLLVETLIRISGGRKTYEEDYEKVPHDDFI